MQRERLIEVSEVHEGEVRATGARLHVRVSGAAFFLGDSAVDKAKEVRELRDACAAVGLGTGDVIIDDVHLSVTTGLFQKSSTASYQLTLRANELERIPELLDVVANAKNCTLDRISWSYEDAAEHERRWLALAASRAKDKASALAGSLGLELGEVHSCREVVREPEASGYLGAYDLEAYAGVGPRRRSVAGALPAQAFAPTQRRTVRVSLAYRVG